MINLSRTKHIQRSFSRAARNYDVYSEMHRSIARRLMKLIPGNGEYGRILDIGQGTGWMTHKLKCRYPQAQVAGMDLAAGMAHAAKERYADLSIVQADARRLPFKQGVFDVVTSNLVYQWLDNLEEAFKLIHSVLKADGVLCMAVFGRETLSELFDALTASCQGERRVRMTEKIMSLQRLPDREAVRSALEAAGFNEVDFETAVLKPRFENMISVMKWIKAIGANALERKFYLGRDQLFKS